MNASVTRGRGGGGSLVAACFAIIVAQVGNVIPAPINGEIQSSLHASGVALSWITSIFLLPTAILELSFGVLGDLLGRRRVLLVGALTVALGSVIAGSARDVAWLMTGQAVAGIGAGALIPTSLAMAVAGARDRMRQGRAVATWALAMSFGTVLGIMASGALSQAISWHASFYATAPLALVCFTVTALFAEESSAPEGRSLDWRGQAAIGIGLLCLLYGVVEGTATSWSAVVIGVTAVGVLGIAAFIAIEWRVERPMLHLAVFRISAFSAAAVAVLIGMFSFLGSVYVLSIRVSTLQGHTGISAAAFFIVLQGVPCLLGPVLPRIMRRIGARWLVSGGLALLAAGEFWLAATAVSKTALSASAGPLLLEGVGFVVVIASMTDAAISAVPMSYTGMASAAISTARDFGMCIGPAVVSAVALHFAVLSVPPAAYTGLQSLAHGYAVGLVLCAVAALVASAVAAFWLRESSEHVALLDLGQPAVTAG